MKTLFLGFTILVLGMSFVDLSAQESTGFTGAYLVVSSEKDFGAGLEVATIKNSVGFGLQAEYIPPENSDDISFTTSRVFLIWKITEAFSIRTALGVEVQNQKEHEDVFASLGFGPMFTFSKMYLGIQPNFRAKEDVFSISNVSFVFGICFE